MPSQQDEVPIPVTVLVRRRARKGCEQQLQDWAVALCADARTMPGHLASTCLRSPVPAGGELLLGMTFASPQDLVTWNDSPERARRLATVRELTEGLAQHVPLDVLAATPALLDAEPAARRSLPRWLSALVIWLAIFPSSLVIAVLVGPALQDWPVALRTLVTTAVVVPFAVYLAVPALHRLLRPWLRRWL